MKWLHRVAVSVGFAGLGFLLARSALDQFSMPPATTPATKREPREIALPWTFQRRAEALTDVAEGESTTERAIRNRAMTLVSRGFSTDAAEFRACLPRLESNRTYTLKVRITATERVVRVTGAEIRDEQNQLAAGVRECIERAFSGEREFELDETEAPLWFDEDVEIDAIALPRGELDVVWLNCGENAQALELLLIEANGSTVEVLMTHCGEPHRWPGLVRGPWTVVAAAPDGGAVANAIVSAGEISHAMLDLQPLGDLRVRWSTEQLCESAELGLTDPLGRLSVFRVACANGGLQVPKAMPGRWRAKLTDDQTSSTTTGAGWVSPVAGGTITLSGT